MHNMKDHAEEPRVFNVLQIVALGIVTTTGAVIAYSAAGAPLGASLLAGFATGPFLTMAIAMSVVGWKDARGKLKREQQNATVSGRLSSGPSLVKGPVSTIEELWNSDRLLEMEFAREQLSQTMKRRPRRAKPADFVPMWDADAAAEEAAAQVAPKRPVRADRRRALDDTFYEGEERRAARR